MDDSFILKKIPTAKPKTFLAEQDDLDQPFELQDDDIWMPLVILIPITIFLAIFFFLIACSRVNNDYFHRQPEDDEPIPNGDVPHVTTSV